MMPVAVVLAGGVGKRFSPFITNKTLFPFMGKPLIAYILEDLVTWGISEAIVVTNPSNHDTIKHLSVPGLTTSTVTQAQPTGMAGALKAAQTLIAKRPILIRNATSLLAPEIADTISPQIAQSQSFLTAVPVDAYSPGGYVQLLGDKPIAILEKPEPSKAAGLLRLSGLYFVADSHSLFTELENFADSQDDAYEQALTRLLKRQQFALVRYTGYRSTLKYAHQVLSTMEIFLTHRLAPQNQGALVHPSAVIEGPVYLEEEVKVLPGAVIIGPTYIGAKAIIGTHTLVRESMIEEGSEVGFGCEIARSYIGPGCKLHDAYVGDSVLEAQVHMGAGSKTANLRLDNQPVRDSGRRKLGALIAKGVNIGINASLMPGVSLGHKSLIGPATLVTGDLKAGLKCFGNTENRVK